MVARHDEAIAEIERAGELDPLSLVIQQNVGIVLYYARRYDAAILESRKTLEIDPNRVYARIFLALSYEEKGMYREAIQEQERVKAYFKGAPTVGLAHVYALSGRTSEARRILRELEQKEDSDSAWFAIASGYAALGEKDHAFNLLEKAFEQHDFFLPTLAVNPWMDPLRSDSRFQDLLRRIGLPE
jgi:tetratricopeptide (TPR) repeat protein